MYVPMFKTRAIELRIIKNMNQCFNEKIIPLIEITKEYAFKDNPEDITTISELDNRIGGHKFFVDFFRYTTEKYGTKIKLSEVELSRSLNSSIELYYNTVIGRTKDYNNIIPVISIKKGYEDDLNLVSSALSELQSKKQSIAFRITAHLLNTYSDIITNYLRKDDYLLLDIEGNNLVSGSQEIEEMNTYTIKAHKIVLNSPRSAELKTKDFEDGIKSILIDNSVAKEYEASNFEGYGDYCGYKDALPPPKGGGTPESGNALAILYNFSDNVFYTFVNKNIGGQTGYHYVISEIIKNKTILGDYDVCPAIKIIERYHMNGQPGGWKEFVYICFVRYLSQVYLNI